MEKWLGEGFNSLFFLLCVFVPVEQEAGGFTLVLSVLDVETICMSERSMGQYLFSWLFLQLFLAEVLHRFIFTDYLALLVSTLQCCWHKAVHWHCTWGCFQMSFVGQLSCGSPLSIVLFSSCHGCFQCCGGSLWAPCPFVGHNWPHLSVPQHLCVPVRG